MAEVVRYIDTGRIVCIDDWIKELLAPPLAPSSGGVR
jgi:hypothetical protein